jgi:hypothetical protein
MWTGLKRFGVPQSRSGRCGEEKILDSTKTRIRPLGRPSSSQSLYRLSYPSFSCEIGKDIIYYLFLIHVINAPLNNDHKCVQNMYSRYERSLEE